MQTPHFGFKYILILVFKTPKLELKVLGGQILLVIEETWEWAVKKCMLGVFVKGYMEKR